MIARFAIPKTTISDRLKRL